MRKDTVKRRFFHVVADHTDKDQYIGFLIWAIDTKEAIQIARDRADHEYYSAIPQKWEAVEVQVPLESGILFSVYRG